MSKRCSIAVQLFDPKTLSFPIKDDVRPAESGQGYALRMAHENHLIGLQQVKRWLGKSHSAALDKEDAELLRKWFGADHHRLCAALGRLTVGKRDQSFEYANQPLGRSYFINRIHPRVCPACLVETGMCKTAWDFSLTVACSHHQRHLVEKCSQCLRNLTWSRPAPRICSCGVPIEKAPTGESPSVAELEFSAWVEHQCVAPSKVPRGSWNPSGPSSPLMQLIWPLSLNGGFHIAYALGTAAMYDTGASCKKLRHRSPLEKARSILCRAMNIADRVSKLEHIQLSVSRPRVVVDLLADVVSASSSRAERGLAQSLMSTVLSQGRARLSGSHPQLAQMALF